MLLISLFLTLLLRLLYYLREEVQLQINRS
uniref:Uncharacterized protein n=1 Tax=Heterorhabditis bacteriophora TaxID=37862 RepID=A0A1I7WBS5_HETBA